MKTTKEFNEETEVSKELQEDLEAIPGGMAEGELDDDGAGEVTGGAYSPPRRQQPRPIPVV